MSPLFSSERGHASGGEQRRAEQAHSNTPSAAERSASAEASREAPAPPPRGEARRLHPLTLVQRILVSLPAVAFIMLPLFTSPGRDSYFSVAFAIAYGVLALPFIVLRYLRFRYWITDREIVVQSGVLNRQDRSIPIERVQNIQIVQSLLPRLMGTATVKVETAGSKGTEGTLEYVSLGEARRIREVVRAFQRQHSAPETAPSGDPSEDIAANDAAADGPVLAEPAAAAEANEATDAAADTLFTMPLRHVLLSGVFRFSLLYIALIFSAFQYVDVAPEELLRWAERGPLRDFTATATASPWLTGLATVAAAGLLSWLTGIAVNLNRYYGFRLHLEEGKLHRRHGLLTLSEGTIPLEKVQALILRTNPLMRRFGWYALELQTMGVDTGRGGHQVAVPFAQLDEIKQLARHIRPFELPETFHRVSPLTIRRASVRYVMLLLAVVTPVAYFFYEPAWWGLALAPALVGLAYLQYTHHGYALQEDSFFVRRGVVKQYVWMLPAEKHQVFLTSASIFQRRLGLKSLSVDTAGAAGFAYPEVVDLPADEAEVRMRELYDDFQAVFTNRSQPALASRPKRP